MMGGLDLLVSRASMGTLLISCALGAFPAYAQSNQASDQQSEENAQNQSADQQSDPADQSVIVVTALRKDTAQQDAAASTSVVTDEEIDDLGGISDPEDLAELLPGVNFVDSGGTDNEISIRGAGASSQGAPGTDSAIAILRDGVQITGGDIGGKIFSRIDTFDLGQAEVVRGPQGSLYGANAVGGVVNLVTKRPKFEQGVSGQIGFTPKVNEFEVEAIGNVPVTDTIAVRFGGAIQRREGGFFFNAALNEFADISQTEVGRVSVLFKPTSNFSNVTVADIGYETGTSAQIRTVRPGDTDGPFVIGFNTRPLSTGREYIFTNTSNWFTGIGDITAISSWRKGVRSILTDIDEGAPGYAGTTAPASCLAQLCTSAFADRTIAYRQELRLSSKLASWLDLITGVNYQNVDTRYSLIRDGFNFSASNFGYATNRSEKQYGAFASADVKLSRSVVVSLAGRYNRSDKRSTRFVVPASGIDPISGATVQCDYLDPLSVDDSDIVENPQVGDPCVTRVQVVEQRFTSFQPTGAIRFALTPRWSVFASVALGFRPGGFNANAFTNPVRETAGQPLIPETYSSEKSVAYEIGTKVRAGPTLVTLTGFTNVYDDVIAVGILEVEGFADSGSDRYRFNAGKARNYGFDAEIAGLVRLSPELGSVRIRGAVTHVKGRFTTGIYDGFVIEGAPTETYTGSLTWIKPVGDGWRLAAGGSYRGERGGFLKSNIIDNTFPRASRDVVKLRLAAENSQFRFEIIGDNILNKTYPVAQTRVRDIFADKRSVMFRVSYMLGSEEARRTRRSRM